MENKIADTVDVVVIGAGIMGLSTAYFLSEYGLNICIIERELHIGGHTTQRCAGGIRQQFSSPLNVALSVLNRKIMQKIEKENRYSVPFNPCGYAFAFTKNESAEQAEKAAEMQRRMRVNTKLLTSSETAAIFSDIYVNDVLLTTYCSEDGLLDVPALIGLLKKVLDKRNVKILCETAACGIETKNGSVNKVLLDRGEIDTTVVVNAAGPWSKQIGAMLGISVPIEPYPQQIWVSEPISWVKSNMPVVIFGDEEIGFHWESGGLLSGYHKPYEKPDTLFPQMDADWEILHCEKAVQRIPSLYDKHLVSRWAGFYETTCDDLPIVGPYGPAGMYCIAGFNGHGITHGLACGYLLSEMIVGKTMHFDMSNLSIGRFKSGKPVNFEKYKI